METFQSIAKRKSTRNFGPQQIGDKELEQILQAACAAPVGHGEYQNLHLTVVQDPDVLDTIRDVAMDCFRDPTRDIYYGAPTVIIISTCHGSVPELDMANAGTIAQNILLAATDLGIDSCYIWGTVLAFRADADLLQEVHMPAGYEPLASIALGYGKDGTSEERPMTLDRISINRV